MRSTERTARSAEASSPTSDTARASSSTTVDSRTAPSESKSRLVATREPSRPTSDAVNGRESPSVRATSAEIEWYAADTNAMRSRSRSTTMRTATLCTRPADAPWLTTLRTTEVTSHP